jgi:hypothetical protein
MLTIRTLGAIALAPALVTPFAPAALAVEPTLSDIASCNEQATAKTSASALPGSVKPTPPTASAPIVEGERDLPRKAGSEKSDPTGSIVTDSDDPLAKGMDARRANDPAYRAAYRACMRARTSQSR